MAPSNPELSTPSAPAPSILEEYELGDTDPAPLSFPDPATAAEQPADAAPPLAATPSRERGPDGRFLPASEEPPAPQHPTYLVRQATEFGMSPEEIAETSTEELGRTLHALTRQILKERHRAADSQAFQETPVAAPAGPVEDDYDLGIDTTEYDQTLIGAFKKQFARQAKELEALKAQLAGVSQREQLRENMSIAERVDRQFGKHEALFGKGRGYEMDGDSPEYLRRVSVLALVQKDKSKGALEAKVERAVKVLFGGSAPAAPAAPQVPSAIEERLAAFTNGALARPTQRAGAPEPLGRDRAARAVAEVQREMGASDAPGESLDDFLG